MLSIPPRFQPRVNQTHQSRPRRPCWIFAARAGSSSSRSPPATSDRIAKRLTRETDPRGPERLGGGERLSVEHLALLLVWGGAHVKIKFFLKKRRKKRLNSKCEFAHFAAGEWSLTFSLNVWRLELRWSWKPWRFKPHLCETCSQIYACYS